MGVSFKVAKNGTRYRPKVNQIEEKDEILALDYQQEDCKGICDHQGDIVGASDQSSAYSNSIVQSGSNFLPQDLEVSFTINLFPDGFCIGKPSEVLQAVPKMLHPYDRASRMLFSAIEYGRLPGDILNNIPCKFLDGTLLCEVRDYRECVLESGNSDCSIEKDPVVHSVCLHLCTESVVKDVSSISDDSWTYNDLLEVEARILKSLQPDLNLDPAPLLDRLCGSPIPKKLNLRLFEGREKRMQNKTSVTNPVSDNSNNENCISNKEVRENSNCNSYPAMGDGRLPYMQQGTSVGLPEKQQGTMQEYQPGVSNSMSFLTAAVPPSSSLTTVNYQPSNYRVAMDPDAPCLGKRDMIESQSTHKPNMKRRKQKQMEQVQIPQHGQIDSILGPSMQQDNDGDEKISPIFGGRDPSYMSESVVEYGPRIQASMRSSNMSQSGVQYTLKHEPMNYEHLPNQVRNFTKPMQVTDTSREHIPHSRAHIPSSLQLSKLLEEDLKREEDSSKRRKSAQLHQPSSPAPSSSEPTSFSRGISPLTTSLTSVSGLKREKATPINGAQKTKQKKTPQDGKRKNISRLKNVSAVESPASVNNANFSCSTSNLVSETTSSLPAPNTECNPVLQRFLKIGELSQRYQLNLKKHNFDFAFHRKRLSHFKPQSALFLLNPDKAEDMKFYSSDEHFMTKLRLWRSHNLHITRVLRFMHQIHADGDGYTLVCHYQRLVVSENPEDGTIEVFIFYGDDTESDKSVSNPKYNVQLFSNAESADLYAAQFTSKLKKEGYFLIDDQAQPFPFRSTGETESSFSELNSGMSPDMLTTVSRRVSDQKPQQVLSKNILLGRQSIPSINMQDSAFVSLNQRPRSHVQYSVPYNTRCLTGNQIVDNQYLLQLMLQNEQKNRGIMLSGGARSRMGYGLGYGSRSNNLSSDPSRRISFPSPSSLQSQFAADQRFSNIRGMQSGSLVDQFQYPNLSSTGPMNSDLDYSSLEHIRRQTQLKSQQIYQDSLMCPYQQLSSGMMDPMSSHLRSQTYGIGGMMGPNPMNPQCSTQTHGSDATMMTGPNPMSPQLNSQTYGLGGMVMEPNPMSPQLSSQTHGSGGMMMGPNPMSPQLSSQTHGSGGMMMGPNPMTPQLSSQSHGSSGMMAMMGPMSPQLSSQTHGSVSSINGSPMEFQSGNGGE
ncbi:hypothetical protein ACHQM5_009630 [Ranunculus cassubicifolius]